MELIISVQTISYVYVFLAAKMALCVMVTKIMLKKSLSKRSSPGPVRDDGEDPTSDDDAVEEVGGKLAPDKNQENIVTS